jgi:hypothetical protein
MSKKKFSVEAEGSFEKYFLIVSVYVGVTVIITSFMGLFLFIGWKVVLCVLVLILN